MKKELEKQGYHVTIERPNSAVDAYIMIHDTDALVLIGHGSTRKWTSRLGKRIVSGGIRLKGGDSKRRGEERIDARVIGAVRRGRKLDGIVVFACGQGGKHHLQSWFTATDHVAATQDTISAVDWINGQELQEHHKR